MFLKQLVRITSLLFILFSSLFFQIHGVKAGIGDKASMLYPTGKAIFDVPTELTLKWQLNELLSNRECLVQIINNSDAKDYTRVIVPCYSGINTYKVTLKKSSAYSFSLMVSKGEKWDDNIARDLNYDLAASFKTTDSTNDVLGEGFVLQSPKNESTVAINPSLAWTVPSANFSTIDMTVCYAYSPTAPYPSKEAVTCDTGKTCNYVLSNVYLTKDDLTGIYWSVVAGNDCEKNIKFSGHFIIKKSLSTPNIATTSVVIIKSQNVSSNSINTQSKTSATTAPNNLRGKILIQVESHGEAWYVNPKDGKRYYMTDGNAAFNIMRTLSLGMSNKDIDRMKTDATYRKKFMGQILLQVESHGEAYYISFDGRYNYLKDGAAAYEIMRKLSLGITNANLDKIVAN